AAGEGLAGPDGLPSFVRRRPAEDDRVRRRALRHLGAALRGAGLRLLGREGNGRDERKGHQSEDRNQGRGNRRATLANDGASIAHETLAGTVVKRRQPPPGADGSQLAPVLIAGGYISKTGVPWTKNLETSTQIPILPGPGQRDPQVIDRGQAAEDGG